MNIDVESRLEQTLVGRAELIDSTVAFTTDDLVRAARSARSRRRGVSIAAVAAGVVAVGLIVTSAVTRPSRSQEPTGPSMSPSVSATTQAVVPPTKPTPTNDGTLPSASVPIDTVKLDLIGGDFIQPWNGYRVHVNLPAGYHASAAARVPNGWVVEAYPTGDNGPIRLYFQPSSGGAHFIGTFFGSWEVSPDGKTLVVAGFGNLEPDPTRVVAFQLSTMDLIATNTFEGGLGPVAIGIVGDWAVVKEAAGDGSPTVAGAWNLKTNQIVRTKAEINTWGVTEDGRILFRKISPQLDAPTACVDIVPISELHQAGDTGLCGADLAGFARHGQVSPHGDLAIINDFEAKPFLVSTTDLRNGQFRPTPIAVPAGSRASFWDTPTSFIIETPNNGYVRCTSATSCTRLTIPTDMPRDELTRIVPHYPA